MDSARPLHIGIMGAGSIGCYVGGRLAADGMTQVTFVGRASLAEEIQRHGLTLREFDHDEHVDASKIHFETDAQPLASSRRARPRRRARGRRLSPTARRCAAPGSSAALTTSSFYRRAWGTPTRCRGIARSSGTALSKVTRSPLAGCEKDNRLACRARR